MLRAFLFSLLVLTGSAAAQDFREDFTRVTPLSFDSGGAVSRQFHLNAESYLRMAGVAHVAAPRTLDVAPDETLAQRVVTHRGGASSFADFVASDPLLDGVVVLHRGAIVFEAYPNMKPWQRHFAWSVSKVVASTAVAALAEQGRIDMQAPVARYAPALAGSAWADVSIQNVADMASGIDCLDSDGYQTPTTCIYMMEESLGVTAPTGRDIDLIAHLRGMARRGEAGVANEYVSANTIVLMLVIEGVTKTPFAQALQELIWTRIDADADALMAISADGYAYASGGLYAKLRDIARFGEIYTRPSISGVLSLAQIAAIQSSGLAFSTETRAYLEASFNGDAPVRAGWQWDMIWADGALYKGGYLGQGLYVDPARDLVIAWFGTGLDYDAVQTDMLVVSRQLARTAPSRARQ